MTNVRLGGFDDWLRIFVKALPAVWLARVLIALVVLLPLYVIGILIRMNL